MTSRFVRFNDKFATSGTADLLDAQLFAKLLYANSSANLFYVDSGSGSDSNDGTSAENPFATIDAAIAATTASQGDVILVMPGHAENIADATTFQVDKAGISIIGMGNGRNRPVFTFTATGGSIELDAANVLISNLVFLASESAVVVGVNVDANDITIDGCEWNYVDTGDDFILHMDIDGVSRTTVQNCLFKAEAAAGSTAAIRIDAAPDTTIRNNTILGEYTAAGAISGTTGSAAASTGLLLVNNVIENSFDTSSTVVDLNNTTTGIVAGNFMASGDGTTAIANQFDPGNCLNFENYLCNAADETGSIVPATYSA